MPQPRELPKILYDRPWEDQPLDLAFTVEVLEAAPQRRWRVLGRSSELSVANAIFEAARRDDPAASLVLRQGETVLRRSQG
jgi:hypothetical protein